DAARARLASAARRADLRRARGERPQQPPDGHDAHRQRCPRDPARGPRSAQLHRLARRLRSAPDRAAARGLARMRRDQLELDAPSIGGAGTVIAYGHWGRPVLAFPAEQGRAWDLESNGMVGAVQGLIDAGRCKLYCVDSFDGASWSNHSIALEDRARAHGAYEAWVLDRVVPFIHHDCGGAQEIVTTGVSLGAF